MEKRISFILILLSFCAFSQQQLNFSFAESPQTLLLNPGAETNFKYHYGIPVVSNFYFDAKSTSFSLDDLFLDNDIGFTNKLKSVLDSGGDNEYFTINTRSDLLYGGFRLNKKTYISFGFYQELDFIFSMPKDILELGLYGNSRFLNETILFSQLAFKGNIQGVLHAGFSKKVNEKFNFGMRAKIYSSSANIESYNNTGAFSTFNNNQNIIRQTINNLGVNVRSSGFLNSNDTFLESSEDLYNNTFFGGNLGVGFDVGFTYHFSPRLELTGSAIDIGFIRYNKEIRNYSAEGNFEFNGIEFEYDPNNPRDYWDELQREFDDSVPITEDQNAYTSWQPMRLNLGLRYGFGEIRSKYCYSKTRKKYAKLMRNVLL